MRTTNRTDGFNDITGVPEFNRDMVRRDAIIKRSSGPNAVTSFLCRTGKAYAPDTTGAAMTGRLPKTANDGAWVLFLECFGQWSTNNFTIDAGPNTIQLGSLTAAQTLVGDIDLIGLRCVYDRQARLWRVTYA